MALTPGTRLGVYEVLGQIGEGGMGRVYQARDTRLNRDVALKVLPDSLALDPDRLARFTREAQTLASLNHPNIASIYGLEESSGVRALVMELVEGDDLSERIARSAIPVDEALPIARQIAEALEAAHERGIIHRDLKPANIKVRPDGTVKVLDFGLAKAMESPSAMSPSVSQAPTITTPAMMPFDYRVGQPEHDRGLTGAGMILGTAAYMSPEQARGKAVDKRADIWAFGCVLYEMLTGTRAFPGKDMADVLGAVIHKEPDWSLLPAPSPASVRRLLQRALQKDRRNRLDSAVAVRLEIDDSRVVSETTPASAPDVRPRQTRTGWAVAGALAVLSLAASTVAVRHLREVPPVPAAARFLIGAPEGKAFAGSSLGVVNFSVSPDGRYLVGVAAAEGRSSLWLRAIDALSWRELPGTDGAIFPFWSPASDAVGFFADDKLKTVRISGGRPAAITEARRAMGGTWGRDDTILFSSFYAADGRQTYFGIRRVAASGGTAVPVLEPDGVGDTGSGIIQYRWPLLLPGGHHLLYLRTKGTEGVIMAASLDGQERRTVVGSAASFAYASGRLFYWRDGSLMAQAFDLDALQLVGEPALVADQIPFDAVNGTRYAPFSVSDTGTVVYVQGDAESSDSQLAWLDRAGRTIETVGAPGNYTNAVALSPDGRRVAVSFTTGSPENRDIWVIDAVRGVRSRVTTHPNIEAGPAWSPDGRQLAFASMRDAGLYVQNSDGSGVAEPLMKMPGQGGAPDWSSDGRFIIYENLSAERGRDLWIVPTSKAARPFPFQQTPANERAAVFSSDTRWIAYTSDESGRDEVYVQPFPSTGARTQVSLDGGGQPLWRDDDRELFYIAADGALMAVPVTHGTDLDVGRPERLFKTEEQTASVRNFAASPDGRRFLVIVRPDLAHRALTVAMNWTAASTVALTEDLNPEAKK